MVKRTIKYVDFLGNERVEDFYFNYTEAELSKLEWSKNGGFSTYIKRIVDAMDAEEIVKVFDQVILDTYGEISLDGKYFLKEDEHGDPRGRAKKFMQSAAYPIFFNNLIENKGALAAFFNELIPERLVKKAEEARLQQEAEEKNRVASAMQ